MDTAMKDFAIEIDALPYCTIEGRVEVIVTSRGYAGGGDPVRGIYDPPEPAEIDLGTIEQVISHVTEDDGTRRWNHGPFPTTPLGKLLEEAVRDALGADEDFIEAAITEAMENAASAREEAMEKRWEERRDEQMLDQMHREDAA